MQDRYSGDLGDFGKFGLLKSFCSLRETGNSSSLSLGVVWYLVPDEDHNDDGKYVQYLVPSARNQEQFRVCDSVLYDALGAMVFSGARSVASIRDRAILPVSTRYYEASLTFDGLLGLGSRQQYRVDLRTAWLSGALGLTAGCDVVFLDPDNGLEVKVGPYQKRGPKYAFFDELMPFLRRGQSLVVYHHVARRRSAMDQVRERLAQIEDRLGHEAFALLYHRGSARAFFVIPDQRHREFLCSRTKQFLQSPWSRHFELVTPA